MEKENLQTPETEKQKKADQDQKIQEAHKKEDKSEELKNSALKLRKDSQTFSQETPKPHDRKD